MTRAAQPDFLIVGAPKAGTTALHAALSQHPEVFVTSPKEPKYWLCDDAPPPAWRGPGDAHSQREWIWRRDEYAALFAHAPRRAVRGESTPFYLWSRGAHRRIAEYLPAVRLIAVVRDPIDRAYSNWMHLWCDGLEPVADFETAFRLQDERVEAGWAPFWRYRDLGRYGEQLAHLQRHVDPERVLVLRYRDIVDDPRAAVDRACRFLGITPGTVATIPQDNSRSYVPPGWRPTVLGPVVRAGAWAGQFAPPDVWRRASAPLVTRLRSGDLRRPRLEPEQRERLLPAFADDVHLLSSLTGQDFSDWLSTEDKGSFEERAKGA
ncbi:sulfotransferase [Nocardioides sp. MAH-18]|uniref:Sulfotransferase n=1 Tax=Nocardioides agri TaxID=2682843 RepID=A0A6L6XQD3_9ACTN|nr:MULTISPECIES: sulfotransferase [unclassified Nocardioides]MBA2954668.1 sulfotransferase [Nocardioides sp. CGMCC 1.13656]MVQ49524.1 sulfotransferase [Nocardioides sp. MAH-18]